MKRRIRRTNIIMYDWDEPILLLNTVLNKKLWRVFDIFSNKYIILIDDNNALFDVVEYDDYSSHIEIYKCAIYSKGDFNIKEEYSEDVVYFNLKKPTKIQLRKIKHEYSEYFI